MNGQGTGLEQRDADRDEHKRIFCLIQKNESTAGRTHLQGVSVENLSTGILRMLSGLHGCFEKVLGEGWAGQDLATFVNRLSVDDFNSLETSIIEFKGNHSESLINKSRTSDDAKVISAINNYLAGISLAISNRKRAG